MKILNHLKNIDLNLISFRPALHFKTGHSQTLLGHFLKSEEFVELYDIEYLRLPDQDQMALKIYRNQLKINSHTNNLFTPKVVVLFHGLGGFHGSDYIQRNARVAYNLGHHVVLVDHRGCGLALGKAQKPYHSGRGDDISHVSLRLRELFKDEQQIFIGFSMSGSILLNLITGRDGKNKPDYAIIVNAPINLAAASEKLNQGFSKIYDYRFYFLLKKLIRENQIEAQLPFLGSTQTIDDLVTSVKSGFKSRFDYYEKCSTMAYLNHIQTPCFILTSQDDPFISFSDYEKVNWNDFVHPTFVEHGGHMGYIHQSDIPGFKKRWLDYYIQHVLIKIDDIKCS